jgi:hypothetical protein
VNKLQRMCCPLLNKIEYSTTLKLKSNESIQFEFNWTQLNVIAMRSNMMWCDVMWWMQSNILLCVSECGSRIQLRECVWEGEREWESENTFSSKMFVIHNRTLLLYFILCVVSSHILIGFENCCIDTKFVWWCCIPHLKHNQTHFFVVVVVVDSQLQSLECLVQHFSAQQMISFTQ